MSRLRSVALLVAIFFVVGIEVQQLIAACQCMCYAVSGKPTSVSVDTSSSTCTKAFSYTYKVHFATNDDSCSEGISGGGAAYPRSSFSCNVQLHTISPTSFTIDGEGQTVTFSINGQLFDEDMNGDSATQVYDTSLACNTGHLHVTVNCDPQCNASCPTSCVE